ncbi:two-component system response regulator [Methyloceanibacter stevinii]|uniref:Two-component system response regulator n=1 Tax=Methyloceanibacter stevinii TaxID=1774970 RepID=A0A1E3VQH0_9HYPH|nr:response regulator transcription factor [Methyloceanibacter stevinii]ODR95551.1 two-component system response regulator [Methyloceanibacter stevinii]
MRILLVEDDNEIAKRLMSGLSQAGFTVERADNGTDGYTMGLDEEYAAAVLDLGLPEMQGIDVLKRWRSAHRALPVLILTARGTWAEKVEGLNAGADDYVTKPFHVPEVAARLRALVRRASGIASAVLTHRGIELDAGSGSVLLNGTPVKLTAREMKMLTYFLHRIGRIVSQAELAEHLYALEDSRESNTIEVYVSRLRRKLGANCITTVRGLGYRMD